MLAGPGYPGPPPPGPPPGPPGGPPPGGGGGYGPAGYRPPKHGHSSGRQNAPPGFRAMPPPGGKPGSSSAHGHRGHQAPAPPPPAHHASSNIIPIAAENRLRRDTPFLAHIRFRNDLPEIPSDPKMLVSQIQPEVLSRFGLTALERQARRDLLTPPNITISPLDVQRYQVPDQAVPMDPADAALLKDDARPLAIGGSPLPAAADGRHKSFAARSKDVDVTKVSWLMRTTYISASDNRGAAKQGLPEKQVLQARAAERRLAAVAAGTDLDDRELNDREAQVRAIEASFEAARAQPVHSRNPALKPVEVLPVLPDPTAWQHKLLLTTFHDSDPGEELAAVVGQEAMAGLPSAKRPQLLVGHYLLKGFTHHISKAGQDRELKIMALLPVLQPEDLEGDYQWTKDYNYELKRDTVHYALRLDKDAARFYRMQGKLELRSWRDEEKLARDRSRKRVMGSANEEPAEEETDGSDQVQRPSKIHVTTRDLNDRELEDRESKRKELMPLAE
eukprot:XP_001696929.1 Paf1 complex component [Chlamydomonas reinhardtii]